MTDKNYRDRDYFRKLKRELKRVGTKRRRADLKRQLIENPEEAHLVDDYDYGGLSTEWLNGMDRDSTRRRQGEKPIQDPQMDSRYWTSYD